MSETYMHIDISPMLSKATAKVASEAPPFAGILKRLAAREHLSRGEAAAALQQIVAGGVSEAEAAAFLMGLRVKGETALEIAGLVDAMRQAGVPVTVAQPERLLDIVGTGGDGLGTFNISTTAAFVAAGAGAKVAKHGNRAASSRCGAADVLEALGVRIDLGPAEVAVCIQEVGMGFMLASRYHPATGKVAPIRRALGVPTVFNFLGPLTNPAAAGRQLMGVNSKDYLEVLASALARGGSERSLVVTGCGGMDEIAVTGPTTMVEVQAGAVGEPFVIESADLGLAEHQLEELAGGSPAENARLTREVLCGAPGGPRDAVLANAAAALYVAGAVTSLRDGVGLARESIDSGRALRALEELIKVSNSFPAARV